MSFLGIIQSPHALVARHFGEGRPLRSAKPMWRHLEGCEPCRERYRAYALLEAMEGKGEGSARQRLMPPELSSLSHPPPARALWAPWMTLALGATGMALWLFIGAVPSLQNRQEFVARGGLPQANEPSLRLFKVPGKQAAAAPLTAAAQVTDAIVSTDGLAFSYTNTPAPGYAYLMVFAATDDGRIAWFWPAWQSSQDDPVAVPILPGPGDTELREAVFHDFAPGKLNVLGLFSNTPTTVKGVERVVREQGIDALANLKGAFLWRQTIEVQP